MSKHCVAIFAITALNALAGGQNHSLATVKRLYVDGLGSRNGAADIRKNLIAEIKKSKAFEIVNSAAEADATLLGEGELYLKGYFSLNPRSGVSPAHGEALYGGSLSVEVRDSDGETLWSYLATPRDSQQDAARAMSRDVVKHLLNGIASAQKGK